MKNKKLTPLKYHIRNISMLIILIVLSLAAIVISIWFENYDYSVNLNKVAMFVILVIAVIEIVFLNQHKKIQKTKKYQKAWNQGTIKACYGIFLFMLLLNPVIQIPAVASTMGAYSDLFKYYFWIQLEVAILIREIIILKLYKAKGGEDSIDLPKVSMVNITLR